jgi:anion-transporting  ArsA/GET3 family ATPase
VLVVEVSPFGRIGEYLGGVTLGPEPVEVDPGLSAALVAPDLVLEEFLQSFLRIRLLTRRLLESTSFRAVAAAAPGLEDFLILRRIAQWESARSGIRRPRWDLVLVDAPATGHSVPLLGTPRSLLKFLPFGPLARAARQLALLLDDPGRTAAALVTLPEEMAVSESLELATALMQVGVTLLPPVVNAVPPLRFSRAEGRRLAADPPDLPPALARYTAVGRFSLARQRAAERQIRRLADGLGERPLLLPQVPSHPFALAAIAQLADAFAGSGRRARRAS